MTAEDYTHEVTDLKVKIKFARSRLKEIREERLYELFPYELYEPMKFEVTKSVHSLWGNVPSLSPDIVYEMEPYHIELSPTGKSAGVYMRRPKDSSSFTGSYRINTNNLILINNDKQTES